MSPRPDVSRRRFLVQSASLAGAGLGTNALAQASGQATDEVRIGIVGLGDRGMQLLSTLRMLPNVRITALSDIHPERLKKGLDVAHRHGNVRGHTDARPLLEHREVDAVVIATPVWLHASQTLAALENGKHVYCEKPIGLDAGECVAVLAAAKRAEDRGQIYQSGFQRRYNPRYRASLEHLSSGEPGSVRFIRAQWHAVGSSRKDKPWLGRRGQSGDIVVEQACHQFDVFHWVFDAMPERAVGLGGAFGHDGVPGRDVLDHYGAVLEFPGGAKVQLSHLQFSVPDRRFAGIYELAFCENGAVDLANALAWDRSGKTRHLAYESGNETQIALASFIDCVRTRRRPLADAAVAYRATLSALLCRRALELSRPVSIDEIVPRGAA